MRKYLIAEAIGLQVARSSAISLTLGVPTMR